MRVEIPGTRSKGLCFGDSPWLALIRNVTAVGHFTTVDNTLSFLSLVFLFVLFPNMWCSFILVIIPPFPSALSSMLRAAVEVVTIPFPPPLHGFLCTGDIPTGYAVLASTVPGLCSPGFRDFSMPLFFRQLLGFNLVSAITSIMATSGRVFSSAQDRTWVRHAHAGFL